GGINVALGVHRHGVNPVELPGIAAAAAKTADYGTIVPFQHPDFVVLAIGAQQIGLLRVGPDGDILHRAIAARVLFVKPFLNEGSIFLEHLDAVVDAVADIEQPVIGEFYAMHGVGELLRGRSIGIVGRLLVVAGRLAVGAPVPLVGAGRRIEHDDAAIAVAVGDIDFVGVLVDRGLGGLAELRGVGRTLARRDLADLHHELAVEVEFQDRVVVVGVAADPHETFLIHFNAVFAADPFVAFAGAAPGAQQIAVGIELEHRRRRYAAFRTG